MANDVYAFIGRRSFFVEEYVALFSINLTLSEVKTLLLVFLSLQFSPF